MRWNLRRSALRGHTPALASARGATVAWPAPDTGTTRFAHAAQRCGRWRRAAQARDTPQRGVKARAPAPSVSVPFDSLLLRGQVLIAAAAAASRSAAALLGHGGRRTRAGGGVRLKRLRSSYDVVQVRCGTDSTQQLTPRLASKSSHLHAAAQLPALRAARTRRRWTRRGTIDSACVDIDACCAQARLAPWVCVLLSRGRPPFWR